MKLTKTLFDYEFIEFETIPIMTKRASCFRDNTVLYYSFSYFTIGSQKNSYYVRILFGATCKFVKITCPKKTFKDLMSFLTKENFRFVDQQKVEERLQKL